MLTFATSALLSLATTGFAAANGEIDGEKAVVKATAEVQVKAPPAATCGFQEGGQCGGTCAKADEVCYFIKGTDQNQGLTSAPGKGEGADQWIVSGASASAGTATPDECKCVKPTDPQYRCKDCDQNKPGLQCAGACKPADPTKPSVCYKKALAGGAEACACQTDVADCKMEVAPDGGVICTGTCSNGGCKLSADATKCECGETCKAEPGRDGGIMCGGHCTGGKLCVLKDGDCSCGENAGMCGSATANGDFPDNLGGSSGCTLASCEAAKEDCRTNLTCPAGCESGGDATYGACQFEDPPGPFNAKCKVSCQRPCKPIAAATPTPSVRGNPRPER